MPWVHIRFLDFLLGISDCQHICLYPCFGKVGKNKKHQSSQDSLKLGIWLEIWALIGRMAKRGEGMVAKDDGQMIARIGCMVERGGGSGGMEVE